MNNMISLEQFRQIKNKMIELYEITNSSAENGIEAIKEFLKIQNELLSYNLSNIPANEWEDMNFYSPNILDFIKDENNFKPEPLDFSKTKANIDFEYFDIDTELCDYNFHNCNVINLYSANDLNEKWFDKETVEKNKDIFLSDNFSDELKNKIYNGKMSYEEWFELPDNLFEEIVSNDFYKYHIQYSNDNNLNPLYGLATVLGFNMTRELYLKHKDQLEEILKHNDVSTRIFDEEGKKIINSFDDINIENMYNNMTDISEIVVLNRSFPISDYNVDISRLKPYIIKHLCTTPYLIEEINSFYSLNDNLNNVDKKNIIETYMKNNGLKYLYSYSVVLNIDNIEFDKNIVLSAFYKNINETDNRIDIESILNVSSIIDFKKVFTEQEVKLLLKKILSCNNFPHQLNTDVIKFKEIFSELNIDYSDMKDDFIQLLDRISTKSNTPKYKIISYILNSMDGIIPTSDVISEEELKKYIESMLKTNDTYTLSQTLPYINLKSIISQIDPSIVQSYLNQCINEIISKNYNSYLFYIFDSIDINQYIDKNRLKKIIYDNLNEYNKDVIENKISLYRILELQKFNINIVELFDKNQIKEIITKLYSKDYYETNNMLDELSKVLNTNLLEFFDKEYMKNDLENKICNNKMYGLNKLYNLLKDDMYSLVSNKVTDYVENLIANNKINDYSYLYSTYDITKMVNPSHIPNILKYIMNQDKINTELITCLVGNHKLEEYLGNEYITQWIENEKSKEEKKYEKILDLASCVDINKFIDNKSQKILEKYKESNSKLKEHFLQFFKDRDIELIDENKIDEVGILLLKIEYSNSTEIRHIGEKLIVQLLQFDNPTEKFEKIENIFLKNNIPYVGKIFSVFQILNNYNIPAGQSNVLSSQNNMERQITIFSDLLNCAIKSGNRDILEYINGIEKGNELFLLVSSEQVKYEELVKEQMELLNNYINQLYVLYENTQKGKKEPIIRTGNIIDDINTLIKVFSKDGKFDYNLPDRIVRMFGHFAGYNTLEDLKKDLEKSIQEAHNKGIENSKKPFKLEDGDFIKGINGVKYLGNILQNGSLAADYLGDNAHSDCTPLDTDLSIINGDYDTIDDAISQTETGNGYGNVLIVLKHHKGRFLRTRRDNSETDQTIDKLDRRKIEAFSTVFRTAYGIRTGFPSSEIDYILVVNYDNRIGFEIARNGFYIPVVDRSGKLVFTIDDYNKIREQMSGLSRYGINDYKLSSSLDNEVVSTVAKTLVNNENNTAAKRQKIQDAIARAMSRLNLELRDSISKDLTPGFVELIDTGSTGRGTNVPNDGDFDFMMKVDQSFMVDQEKLEELKKEIRKEFKYIAKDESNNGNFRYKGVTIEGLDEPVDIDITFVVKTNKVTYSTDMCVKDRLNSIKEQYPDKYDSVVANIIVAKKIFKKFEVYKNKNNHDNPQGGLGGVGIENWILQHGGSFEEAAKDFLAKSQNKSFEEFAKEYPIWDFGENHMGEKHEFLYDNYIYNMDASGYTKMKNALQYYLDNINKIDLTDVESLNKII